MLFFGGFGGSIAGGVGPSYYGLPINGIES